MDESPVATNAITPNSSTITPNFIESKRLFSKNLAQFKERFPAVYLLNKQEVDTFTPSLSLLSNVKVTKNSSITASYGSTLLHSLYNPQKEAERLLASAKEEFNSFLPKDTLFSYNTLIFLGSGLGYPLLKATEEKNKTLILVEPSVYYLLSTFLYLSYEKFFSYPNILLLLSATPEQFYTVYSHYKAFNSVIVTAPQYKAHDLPYFSTLESVIEDIRRKERINYFTKKKFLSLWQRNARTNLPVVKKLTSISEYKDKYKGASFILVAGGATLEESIAFIKLNPSYIIVAAAATLTTLAHYNISPHFIVIADPQYIASLQLAFTSNKKSVLVTTIECYPSVLRYDCANIAVAKSVNPYIIEIEKKSGASTSLSSGGSVATFAFSLCLYLGASTIYLAGLDLSYTYNLSHVKGSYQENASYLSSNRIKTVETFNVRSLFSTPIKLDKDYTGQKVLTSESLLAFRSWFNNAIKNSPCRVISLSSRALKLEGVSLLSSS